MGLENVAFYQQKADIGRGAARRIPGATTPPNSSLIRLPLDYRSAVDRRSTRARREFQLGAGSLVVGEENVMPRHAVAAAGCDPDEGKDDAW